MRDSPSRFLAILVGMIVLLAAGTPAGSAGGSRGLGSADPDRPSLRRNIGGAYLRLRAHQIALYRGFPFDLGYNPRLRAIHQFELQLGAERARAAASPAAALPSWKAIGPAPIPNGQTFGTVQPVSGRVTAIAVHPTNPSILYVGTADGGVYRTLDGGTSWTPIFDRAQSLAIGAIAIDPVTPSTVFVGTGEGNLSEDSFEGVGLYRIKNADTTPVLQGPFETRVDGTGTTASNGHAFLNSSITKIAIDPNNDNRMFVGNTAGFSGISGSFSPIASWGLYFTANAQGTTPVFSQLGGLPGSGGGAVTDALFQPGSSDNLVVGVEDFTSGALGSGVYRTTNASTASQSPSVSPTFSRTFSLSGTDRNIKLATDKVGSTTTVLAGIESGGGTVMESTDGGATWPTTLTGATGFCDSQCWYDMALAIDPANPNVIYLGGAADGTTSAIFDRSTNGSTFTKSETGLHADTHAIAVAPSNTSVIYTGNDGGIFKSTDGGMSWTSLNNSQFNATQFQSVAVHPTDPKFTLGGTQDNGTNLRGPTGSWTRADFGDAGFALIDRNAVDTSNVTMYHTYFNESGLLIGLARVTSVANAHDNGWAFFGCGFGTPNGIGCSDATLFYAPMALGPGTPNTLYFGTDRLYRSTNEGTTMPVVSQAPLVDGVPISAIGIAPTNDSVRIVGLANGQVFATTTGSSTLTDVTGSWPARYVARTAIDPTNPNVAYVSLDGFMGGPTSHVWKTTNLNGAPPTWTQAGSGIPDVPVNGFTIDPKNPNQLFAGTDVGVYRSSNGGATWHPFGTGLPIVAVFDMAIAHPGTISEVLRIATHGRGMWEIPVPKPALTVSPTSGPPGTTANVTGTGFGPNETIKLSFKDFNGTITALGTALTDGEGAFSRVVTIPLGAASGAGKISAKGVTSHLAATKTFTVT